MKLKITSLLCIFLAIACSTEEIETTETATLETITLNQRIVNQLHEDGFEAAITDENKIVSTGFKDPESFISKMNSIFDTLGESTLKIDVKTLTSQTDKNRSVQCEQGEIYTSDDGATCATFVCWGPELEPLSMGSADGDHYYYFTSCY